MNNACMKIRDISTIFLIVPAVLLAVAPACFGAGLAVDPFVLFDPDGASSLSGNTADSTTATLAAVTGGNATRQRVTSNFTPADISQIGQSVQVSFDLMPNNAFVDNNRGDLHLSLFDSVAGSELLGLVHLGENPGRTDFLKFRIDNDISPTGLGAGGNSRGGEANAPGGITLSAAGVTHSFSMLITRASATEHSFSLSWANSGGISTYSFNSYNETTGVIDGDADPANSDVWNGPLNRLDGFSILLHDDDPFNPANPGSYTISNFTVTGTAIPEPSGALLAMLASLGLMARRQR
ncbi:MAG: hypothetical protein ACI9UA_004879 [Pseudoalteromonas tetraodonis]|jgi:hypothetical protein